jgi:hypothetical protein
MPIYNNNATNYFSKFNGIRKLNYYNEYYPWTIKANDISEVYKERLRRREGYYFSYENAIIVDQLNQNNFNFTLITNNFNNYYYFDSDNLMFLYSLINLYSFNYINSYTKGKIFVESTCSGFYAYNEYNNTQYADVIRILLSGFFFIHFYCIHH